MKLIFNTLDDRVISSNDADRNGTGSVGELVVAAPVAGINGTLDEDRGISSSAISNDGTIFYGLNAWTDHTLPDAGLYSVSDLDQPSKLLQDSIVLRTLDISPKGTLLCYGVETRLGGK